MSAAELIERLERVKRSGEGWVARCPAHEDNRPSLSITEGEDGRVLLHCFAGCTVESIAAALGLELTELFADNGRGSLGEPEAVYDYTDETGALLFQVLRLAGKRFLQRRPDGNGGWIWKLGETRRVLYRLPRVLEAVGSGDTVYVCEGERDVHAAEGVGVVATTNPGGAGKWRDEFALELQGASIVLVADNDEPGLRHAREVACSLEGTAATVDLVGPLEGKDLADHLAAGLTLEQLEPLTLDWIETQLATAEADDVLARENLPGIAHAREGATVTWERLSEIDMRSIVFADKPLLQADAFHLVAGRKGMGKGTLLACWAACVTRGELGGKRNVVWIGSEDSAAIDIKPRLVAARGDPARVLIVKSGWIQLPRDIDEISRAMTDLGEVGMVVVDPVGNHIAGKESNSETDIRDAIAPLNTLADEHGCMVFGVRHLSEKECSRGVLAAILGSSAWVQVPRAVLAVARDNEDPQISHVQCVAGNRLPADTPGRMFRIEGVLLPGLENEVTCAVWMGESTKDVETILSAGSEKPPSKSKAARELILDILDAEGEQESDTLDARVAREAGIAAKTVQNIRSALRAEGLVKPRKQTSEDGTVEQWLVGRTNAPREGGA
jgi:putative DNA primase/helicase